MSNTINLIRSIVREKQLGWPNGTGELYKKVDVLLRRIDDLERALVPVARAYILETQINSGAKLLHVNKADAKTAFDILDTQQSVPLPKDTFFNLPAE